MADVFIGNLPAASAANATDRIPSDQGAVTRYLTTQQIANFIIANSAIVYISTPAVAPTDGNIPTSAIALWIDEGADKLMFRVKYSDNSLATGQLSIVPD